MRLARRARPTDLRARGAHPAAAKMAAFPVRVMVLDGEWKAVEGATAAEKAAMRFFKVVVEVQ